MDGRLIWTDCDKAGYYVVPNVLSPRDLVSRPDNMDETVPHNGYGHTIKLQFNADNVRLGLRRAFLVPIIHGHHRLYSGW